MKFKLDCKVCNKEFFVHKSRLNTAETCSVKCASLWRKSLTGTNSECTFCGKSFHMKPSQKVRYERTLGCFCSIKCSALSKSSFYSGDKNPNYKGKNTDSDGYRVHIPYGNMTHKKLHIAVACATLEIALIPEGFHVHHRNCDILDNRPENLSVLSASDHKWLHKQFGNATLWAFCQNKINLEQLVSWSDDPDRAQRILPTSVLNQIGVFKVGELLETPEADNQQPSLISNDLEGSETSSRDVPGKADASNAATSADHVAIHDDIVRTACIMNEDAEPKDKEPLG